MSFLAGLRRQFVLGRISGIPVRADSRWFLVIGVMTVLIAASVTQLGDDIGFIFGSILGLSATLIFFLSIFLHEFAHAAVARIERLDVVEIVLHPFGGLTRFRHEPETPRAEFTIAIAGPAASFVLAVLFAGLATIGSAANANVLVVLGGSLAILNFLIAVFNLLPGYPLDGGRVLRAYLWRSGRDLNEATVLTGRFGQAIAGVLIVFGLFVSIFRQGFFTGFWAVLTGLFLYDSAKRIIAEVRSLEYIPVENAMMLAMPISPDITVQYLIDTILPMNRSAAFCVASDRRLLGMLTLEDLMVDTLDRRNTLVRDVMRPVDSEQFVETGSALSAARELARTNGIGAVAVTDSSGELLGMIYSSVRIKQ